MVLEQNCFLIPSSGVDIQRFIPKPEVVQTGLVVLAARLLWDKGIGEFVEAARSLKPSYPDCRFVLVGSADMGNPSSISNQQTQEWVQEGIIEWWGWREDMVSVYQQAEIVCLPSYHEGLSKSLIEAAACGRPLVATDIPGCREVVRQGVNGLVVPKGDALALADAIIEIRNNPKELIRMGKMSRKVAVSEFSVKKVIDETIRVYNKMTN
jgi:glycosyltransferase involved in cell wall biosynthesis